MPPLGCFIWRAAARKRRQEPRTSGASAALSAMPPVLFCDYCAEPLVKEEVRSRHVAATPLCQMAEQLALAMANLGGDPMERPSIPGEPEMVMGGQNMGGGETGRDGTSQGDAGSGGTDGGNASRGDADGGDAGSNGQGPGGRRRMKGVYVEKYPDPSAGTPISPAMKDEPDMGAYMRSCGALADPAKFELAELLLTTGLSDGRKDKHLKSRMYKGKPEVPWPNVGSMLKDVDVLPHGPDWTKCDIEIESNGKRRVSYLFARDVVKVIRDIIGNTQLKDHMSFAPQRHWTEETGGERIYSEMWTADWWWRMQARLGFSDATIAALIVATDQTELSVMCGGQKAYPVYLSLGNIEKSVRRQVSKRAMVLIGYLPVEDFSDIPSEFERQRLKGQLIHSAMALLMAPLQEVSRSGVEMWCADGRLRRVFPILAAYIGDWPEQCLMACIKQSCCPVCRVEYHERGNYEQVSPLRRPEGTLHSLKQYFDHDDRKELDERHLKPWWPWWANLPHVDIHASLTPDLLHQLWQGMFKTHIKEWMEFVVGEKVLDERFMAMPVAESLTHFPRGITSISQWTGRESKEMAKQLLPAVAGTVDGEVADLVRAGIEFMYRAHAASMTESDIQEMEDALGVFQRLKDRMVSEGYYESSNEFNIIPKFHMVTHYPCSTREFGTPDGYNSETPEHLHIQYAKEPWRSSNKVEPQPQMVVYIQRLEAIRIHRAYINSYYGIGAESKAGGSDAGSVGAVVASEDFIGPQDAEREEGWEGGVNRAGMASEADADGTAYPRPHAKIARTPTKAKTRGTTLVKAYGATDLIPALTKCLQKRYNIPPHDSLLSKHHDFDVWHRLYLFQRPLDFAPLEPARRDVVRTVPPTFDRAGNVRTPGTFDTVFITNTTGTGLNRYRAVRVRAIFKLPRHLLKRVSDEHFAYVELFNPFSAIRSPFSRLHTISTALDENGRRLSLVVPISDIKLACHISPQFKRLDPELKLTPQLDLLTIGRHFFLNPFFNHYFFMLLDHWRRHTALVQSRHTPG